MQLKLGKDLAFYHLLEQQAEVAHRAAVAFDTMVKDLSHLSEHTEIMAKIEQEGDALTYDLQNRIATTFITPLDKEDLKDLSHALDDITDYIEAGAARAGLYRLYEPRPDLAPLSALLVKATAVVVDTMSHLRKGLHNSEPLRRKLEEIHTIENESDAVFRAALTKLFDEPPSDVLLVIKWKEIYDRIETAIDKCEDVAKIIGTVLVKYA